MVRLFLLLLVFISSLCAPRVTEAEPPSLPALPLRSAFGSRCALSPVPCNRIDYFAAHFHLADLILLPATAFRGWGGTLGYGTSLALFHRVEVGIGGAFSIWNQPGQGLLFQNGPALLNLKGIVFPLLRNPIPDQEFTFGIHLQQQLRIPHFAGRNDLGLLSPLTVLRAVADKPFWRLGLTASLGLLLTQGRTDSELSASIRLHIPGMQRATIQGFGVLQGLFGSRNFIGLRGGLGLALHFAWDNGTSLSGGYVHGSGDGVAPSAIYLAGPDYHIGRESTEHSYTRPPIPNRESVPSPWPWLIDKLRQEWSEAELANEAHRRGEDWLTEECFLYEDGKYEKPLRHLGRRDASGKFCDVGGRLVPMDEPLAERGTDLFPMSPIGTPPATPTAPRDQATTPVDRARPGQPSPSTLQGTKSAPSGRERTQREQPSMAAKERESERASTLPQYSDRSSGAPSAQTERPSAAPQCQQRESSIGESVYQFAKGVTKGVSAESKQIYEDTKALPEKLFSTGKEIIEDVERGRPLRALVPLRAVAHAVRNASLDDVDRIAEATIEGAKEWWKKPPYEKGEDVGRVATSIAADAAINVLTEGLGIANKLGKAAKRTAEVAHKARDAERMAVQTAHSAERIDEAVDGVLAGAKAKRVPNPHGSHGAPDHRVKVDEIELSTRQEFSDPRYRVQSNKELPEKERGLTRRPDVAVVDRETGETIKIHEVGRTNQSGTPVPRERKKFRDYDEHGIPYQFHPLGPKNGGAK